jgi:hypothetical protein
LFYEYCIKQGIDPYDRVLCDRWRPVHSTISSEVAGEYHYVAKWPDGVEVKNEIDFENLGDDRWISLPAIEVPLWRKQAWIDSRKF